MKIFSLLKLLPLILSLAIIGCAEDSSVSNTAPVVVDITSSIDEDSVALLTLTGTDVDGGSLSYSITQHPQNGTLDVSGNQATYTPAADFNGTDNFQFVANDGSTQSNTGHGAITVNSVNDAPVAQSETFNLNEDMLLNFTLYGTDVDTGDTLVFNVPAQSTNGGAIFCEGSSCTYQPPLNSTQQDSFDYSVSDDSGQATAHSQSVTSYFFITNVNDAPEVNTEALTLVPPVITVNEGSLSSPLDVSIYMTDPDEFDFLSYQVSTAPANGSVTCNSGNCTYLASGNFF